MCWIRAKRTVERRNVQLPITQHIQAYLQRLNLSCFCLYISFSGFHATVAKIGLLIA